LQLLTKSIALKMPLFQLFNTHKPTQFFTLAQIEKICYIGTTFFIIKENLREYIFLVLLVFTVIVVVEPRPLDFFMN